MEYIVQYFSLLHGCGLLRRVNYGEVMQCRILVYLLQGTRIIVNFPIQTFHTLHFLNIYLFALSSRVIDFNLLSSEKKTFINLRCNRTRTICNIDGYNIVNNAPSS